MRQLLKNIAKVSAGQNAPQGESSYCDVGTPFVKAGSLACLTEGKSINDIPKISDEASIKNKLKLFKKGTVVFAKSGMSCLKGYVYVLPCDAYVVNHLACITPNEDISDYLCLYFSYKKPNRLVKDEAYPSISLADIGNIEIDLKNKEQRKSVVYVLNAVKRAISLYLRELKILDQLVKSRFVEMFGNPISNSHKLPLKTLPELGELGRGVSKHRPRNAPELLGGVYPLIQTGDIANASLYILEYNSTYSETGYKQSKMWNKGTLCITIAANIAKTAILTFDSCFPDSVVGFNANESTNNIFIHFWFSFFQEILEEQAPESAQKNINLKILSELKVIAPPLDLQNQFADFVTKVETQKAIVQKSIEKLETLKKSLMQEYFG